MERIGFREKQSIQSAKQKPGLSGLAFLFIHLTVDWLLNKAIDKHRNERDEQEKIVETHKALIDRFMKTHSTVIDEKNTAMKTTREEFQKCRHQVRNFEQLEKKLDALETSISRKNSQFKDNSEQLDCKKMGITERLQEQQQKMDSKFAEKIDCLEEKNDLLDIKIEDLQLKISEIHEKINQTIADSQKERLTNQLSKAEEKLSSALEERLSLEHKIQDIQQKKSKTNELIQQKAEAHLKKISEDPRLQQYQNTIDSLETQKKEVLDGIQKSLQQGGMKTSEEMKAVIDNFLSSHQNYTQAKQEYDNLMKPILKKQEMIKIAKDTLRHLDKQSAYQAHQSMKKIQEKAKSQGLPIPTLVETTQELEGWDAANEVQSKWDERISKDSQESIINGRWGGRGTRDVLLDIREKIEGINSIDPTEIFRDVASLSPMSGLTENGSSQKNDGHANNRAPILTHSLSTKKTTSCVVSSL